MISHNSVKCANGHQRQTVMDEEPRQNNHFGVIGPQILRIRVTNGNISPDRVKLSRNRVGYIIPITAIISYFGLLLIPMSARNGKDPQMRE